VPDAVYPGMYRLVLADGSLSDMDDRLIQTVDDINPVVLTAYGKLLGYSDDRCVEANIEAHNVMLRQVGFHARPKTAEEFCCDFIAIADRDIASRTLAPTVLLRASLTSLSPSICPAGAL
jgi:hypothetical protein